MSLIYCSLVNEYSSFSNLYELIRYWSNSCSISSVLIKSKICLCVEFFIYYEH